MARRIFALISTLLVLALVAGCGSSKPAPPPAPAQPSPAPSAPKAPVELSFYFPVAASGSIKELVDNMVSDFNKANPDIHVTPSFTGTYDDTMVKVQSTPPDVFVVLSTDTITLVDQDMIVPLDPFIQADKDGQDYINDFLPAFMANSKLNGKVWGIPFQRSTPVLYYNKDMFKAAGITDPPKNWDEMVADAKKLTKSDGSIWGIEIPSDGFPYWTFQGFFIGNGKNLMNDAGTETYFNDPAVVQVLQDLLDLSKVHKVEPPGVLAWANIPTDFSGGKTAMAIHTSGSLVNIVKNSKFEVGLSYIPGRKGFGAPTGGGNLYISKASSPEKQKAAWTFVRWLSSPEQAARWSTQTGYIAPRNAAWDTQIMKDALKTLPQLAQAKDGLKYAAAELTSHERLKVYTAFNTRLQDIVTGKSDPKTAMDAAQGDTEKILAKWKK